MIYVGRLAKAQAAWDVTHGTLAAEGTSPFFQPLERRGVCQAHNGHGYMYIYMDQYLLFITPITMVYGTMGSINQFMTMAMDQYL